MWKAGPVAECTLTSVNDHAASPQFDTTAVAELLLPTARLPKSSTSLLMHHRPAPCADCAVKAPIMTTSNTSARRWKRTGNLATGKRWTDDDNVRGNSWALRESI